MLEFDYMAAGLNPQQATFVKKLINGSNGHDAAILAGYSKQSADSISSQLIRNPKVVLALERAGLTDHSLTLMLKRNIKSGNGVKATADTSLRGIELAYRLKGYLDKPDNVNLSQTNININQIRDLDDNQLNDKLNQLLQDVQELKSK